jgi:hypothetical protein
LLPPAIVLKREACVMKTAAVSFDDQTSVAPEEVGLEPMVLDIQRHVDLRSRKPRTDPHSQELTLQFATRPLGRRIKFVKEEAKSRNATTPAAAAKQETHGGVIEDAQNLCLGDRPSQFPNWHNAR